MRDRRSFPAAPFAKTDTQRSCTCPSPPMPEVVTGQQPRQQEPLQRGAVCHERRTVTGPRLEECRMELRQACANIVTEKKRTGGGRPLLLRRLERRRDSLRWRIRFLETSPPHQQRQHCPQGRSRAPRRSPRRVRGSRRVTSAARSGDPPSGPDEPAPGRRGLPKGRAPYTVSRPSREAAA